jgi:hypothetical protein
MGRITIKDMAKLFNVNPSTVSRALKDHPDISVFSFLQSLSNLNFIGCFDEKPPKGGSLGLLVSRYRDTGHRETQNYRQHVGIKLELRA